MGPEEVSIKGAMKLSDTDKGVAADSSEVDAASTSSHARAGSNERVINDGEIVVALFAGFLGSGLIIVSSFVRWVEAVLGDPSTPAFSAFILILGIALLVGVLIANAWPDRLAGGIFVVIISGGFCITGFIFTAIHISTTPVTDSIGIGAYLGLAGGLCGLLGGLLFLSSRKRRDKNSQPFATR